MFGASTLISSTLLVLASLRAVSAADITLQAPPTLEQCHAADFTVQDAALPYDLEIFTSCADTNDAPIAVFEDVSEATVRWKDVTAAGGSFVFIVVTDANGREFVSKDIEVKGTDAASCLASVSVSATATQSASGSASSAAPTPSKAGTDSTGAKQPGAAPNNAAKDPNGADTKSTGVDDSVTNSASSTLASRPLELAAGVLALAALALY